MSVRGRRPSRGRAAWQECGGAATSGAWPAAGVPFRPVHHPRRVTVPPREAVDIQGGRAEARRPARPARRFRAGDRPGQAPGPRSTILHGRPSITTDASAYDATVACGPRHVMVAVNAQVAIYDKAAVTMGKPCSLDAWFAGVLTGNLASAMVFDPRLLFDQYSQRWILVAAAMDDAADTSAFLLSISRTDDPTGDWWNWADRFAMRSGGDSLVDYPRVGVDGLAVYLTANLFTWKPKLRHAVVRIVPKNDLYAGGAAAFTQFTGLKNPDGATVAQTVQPTHAWGQGADYYLANALEEPSNSALTLWRVTGAGSAAPTLRRCWVPTAYVQPPRAVQPDLKADEEHLPTGTVRVLNAIRRGKGLWLGQTVGNGTAAAARWVAIDLDTLTATAVPVGAGGAWYAFPAIALDAGGRVTMVVSRVSATDYASLHYTTWARSARTAANTVELARGEALHFKKSSPLSGKRNRWADYNGAALDPDDETTVWCYGGFAKTREVWGTWLAAVRPRHRRREH